VKKQDWLPTAVAVAVGAAVGAAAVQLVLFSHFFKKACAQHKKINIQNECKYMHICGHISAINN
jgi:hypothetical protein